VITVIVSEITQTGALSGGNITDDGGAAVTERGICWATTPGPDVSDSKTLEGSGSGSFASSILNLEPGTTYYVCAYATNTIGTAYGNEVSFTTGSIIVKGDSVSFYGDSITEGFGASDPSLCWVSLFGKSKLFTTINYGVSGASLQNSMPTNPAGAPNFRDAVGTLNANSSSHREKLCLAYGTNDVGFNFDGWTVAVFQQQYREVLQILSSKGWTGRDIILISPYYSTQTGRNSYIEDGVTTASTEQRLIDHVQAVRELGIEFNCQFIDVFTFMKDNGGVSLLNTDGLHPNDAGYAAIASYIQTIVL
jgi:lysophospholipase L1-like esterase